MAADTDFDVTLAAAQRGTEWAFAELYRAYNPRVERYLRARLHPYEEDVAADVWIAVAKSIGTFSGNEMQFRAWLFTLVRRRIADHQRAWARSRTDSVDPQHLVDLPGDEDTARAAVDHMRAYDAVAMLVNHLSHDQADVVLLRVLGGLDATEVASMLGRSENWVRVTQHRALRRLAQRVGAKVVMT